MRNTYFLLLVFAFNLCSVYAQQNSTSIDVISDFENLELEPDSYWNGADYSGGFYSGLVHFPNDYDSTWGAWNNWAYSNMADDTTAFYTNQFSAITAAGFDPVGSGGRNYGVAFVAADLYTTQLIPISLSFINSGSHIVKGFYVTNATFPALSMEFGDDFSKKFGGETGNDPDYFKLKIWGVLAGVDTEIVEFFLADYRFENNDEDYIVNEWIWVDLESLGEVDSLMFSLESTDNGMFGMNTPSFFCIDNLTIEYENLASSDYIAEVIEYLPAPGQQINAAPWGIPSSANSIIGGIEGSLSLGAFGGYTIFRFDHAVENHPDNPYGVDFSIFGNPSLGSSEPGQVYVMKDDNWNGQADDEWYLLAGSDHFFSKSNPNYEVLYMNPGAAEDVPWEDNQGGSGFIYANTIHTQEYYPDADSFPAINPEQYSLRGFWIEGSIDTTNPAFVQSYQRAFGYADNHSRGAAPYTLPDNPYTEAIENSGGDAFDISWAVDTAGNYVDLDMIHFVKVQTAVMGNAGWLGEISTEVTGAVDVEPNTSVSGITDAIVIADIPSVIDTNHYQLESYVFESGRYDPEAEVKWETSVGWASINDDGLLTVTQSGEFDIIASMFTNPEASTSLSCKVELPAGIPSLSKSRILLYPLPANDYVVIRGVEDAEIEIYNAGGIKVSNIKNYSEGDAISISDLPVGMYFLNIRSQQSSRVLKLIKQ